MGRDHAVQADEVAAIECHNSPILGDGERQDGGVRNAEVRQSRLLNRQDVMSRQFPEITVGGIRVFCSNRFLVSFGFESRFQGGDDGRPDGRSDCFVQRCGPEVDRSRNAGLFRPR